MRGSIAFVWVAAATSVFGFTAEARALPPAAVPAPPAPAPAPVAPAAVLPPAPTAPAGAAAAPVPPIAPVAPAAAAKVSAPPHVATVTFQADDPDAVLESDWSPTGPSAPWYVVCRAPCELEVSADSLFRASGPDLYESMPFRLPSGRDHVVVQGEMEGRSVAAPVLMTVVGAGLFAFIGPVVLLVGVDQQERHGTGGAAIAVGGTLMLGGGVLATVGVISLIIKSQHRQSRVQFAGRAEPHLALPGGLGLEARGLTF